MSIADYRAFIASRKPRVASQGIVSSPNAAMKAHQSTAVAFNLARGKSADFLDTGLGKSLPLIARELGLHHTTVIAGIAAECARRAEYQNEGVA